MSEWPPPGLSLMESEWSSLPFISTYLTGKRVATSAIVLLCYCVLGLKRNIETMSGWPPPRINYIIEERVANSTIDFKLS